MTLDERIKQFRQHLDRPISWKTARSNPGYLVRLVYDLIDSREELKAELLLRREA